MRYRESCDGPSLYFKHIAASTEAHILSADIVLHLLACSSPMPRSSDPEISSNVFVTEIATSNRPLFFV